MTANSLALMFPSNCTLPRRSLKACMETCRARRCWVQTVRNNIQMKMKIPTGGPAGGCQQHDATRQRARSTLTTLPSIVATNLFSNRHRCHRMNHPAARAFSAESHTHTHTQISHKCWKIHNNDEGKQLPKTTPTYLFRIKLQSCVRVSHFSSFSAVDAQLRDPRWASCTLMIRCESKFGLETRGLITNYGENVPEVFFVCLFFCHLNYQMSGHWTTLRF